MANFLTVVSGLPRSGTSLMMAALRAGGMDLLTDGRRPPDVHNPGGYFEDGRVLQLAQRADWLEGQQGKAVKILSHLLRSIPCGVDTRILLMRRPLGEIVRSQNAMLGGTEPDGIWEDILGREFAGTLLWLQEEMARLTLEVAYHGLLQRPRNEFGRVAAFLERDLDIEAMVRVVDPSLYRQRDGERARGIPSP